MNFPKLPFSERCNNEIKFIIIHCCAYPPEKAVLSFKENDVSAHYIISAKGEIFHLVDEQKCAWHAGKSFWRGLESLNKYSIGIELQSPSLGQNSYPEPQIYALISLLKKIQKKYKISPQNILGHSDIAPNRKPDPGKSFPWKKLIAENLGVGYNIKDAKKIKSNDLLEILSLIGYDTSNLNAALCAFCRHFYPSRIKKLPIFDVLDNPYKQDIILDSRLKNRIKAVAYAYCKASKKPCRI